MYELEERVTTEYVVTCKDGEAVFYHKHEAEAFIKLHELATPLTMEQVHEGVKGTPEQVAAWTSVGSCPSCGGNQGNGDLEIEHLDGNSYAAECHVCGTRFGIYDGESEVIF